MIPSITLGETKDEVCYRVISPAYAGTPLSGMGAARQGGRFNRPGQEAIYLALDEATALAEYKQDNPWLRPGTICTFFVEPPTWYMADDVVTEGLAGKAPSCR